MIILKISNASEVVASKVGKFIEFLTPDSIDHATVEDQVIKKLIENLAAEGIKGEIAAITGLCAGLILMLAKRMNAEQPLPFGPFLASAGFINLSINDPVWRWLF